MQADVATNTLLISAPEPVYRNLRRVIDQLDQRRAQVLVESLIVEVNQTDAAELGVQWMLGNGRTFVAPLRWRHRRQWTQYRCPHHAGRASRMA